MYEGLVFREEIVDLKDENGKTVGVRFKSPDPRLRKTALWKQQPNGKVRLIEFRGSFPPVKFED
jgi:hypothetical protein